MKIACIGWGSLVWNPGVLRCKGDWHPDGPELPLEFARTSNDGRLTLVLTSGAVLVPALWVEVDYASPEQAQSALAGREGSSVHAIGLWPGASPRHSLGADTIAAWAERQGIDAVVWTALGPKFAGKDGHAPEGPEAAVAYLRALDGEVAAKAKQYVGRTPLQVRTPFRAAIESELGWLPE